MSQSDQLDPRIPDAVPGHCQLPVMVSSAASLGHCPTPSRGQTMAVAYFLFPALRDHDAVLGQSSSAEDASVMEQSWDSVVTVALNLVQGKRSLLPTRHVMLLQWLTICLIV